MQDMIEAKLSAAGFDHYETSAYAKIGKRSKHNMNYWQFGDYVGIGAGAHGKISYPDPARGITREARFKQPKNYMEQAALGLSNQEEKIVRVAELPFEFMLNALRLTDGFANTLFVERTGLPISIISRELEKAASLGLIERDHLQVKPTAKGRLFLNDLLELFLTKH
jgi:coproporphyrinogen III oxidase-like Fe-S oxidoreductase